MKQNATTSALPVGYFGASTGVPAALVAAASGASAISAIVSRGGRPDLAGAARLRSSAMVSTPPTISRVGGVSLQRAELAELRCKKHLAIYSRSRARWQSAIRALRKPDREPEQVPRELRSGISSWVAEVSKATGYAEIARIRKYRYEDLAHSAGLSRRPRVSLPSYGDEQKVLARRSQLCQRGTAWRPASNTILRQPKPYGGLCRMICGKWFTASRGEKFVPAPGAEDAGLPSIVIKG
jgi:hypothetical protein